MTICTSDRQKTLVVCAALVTATFIAYWPVTLHPFLDLDDGIHVYENVHVRTGLTWDNFVWSWGLGLALRKQGLLEEAWGHFQQALRLKPNLTSAQVNLR